MTRNFLYRCIIVFLLQVLIHKIYIFNIFFLITKTVMFVLFASSSEEYVCSYIPTSK